MMRVFVAIEIENDEIIDAIKMSEIVKIRLTQKSSHSNS